MDSNHDFRVQERNVSNPRDALDRLEVTFNQLFNRIEVVMRQLRQFVTDGSHELRTPLAILQGETELLLSRPRTIEDYERTVKRDGRRAQNSDME